jgi:hypothetical protein
LTYQQILVLYHIMQRNCHSERSEESRFHRYFRSFTEPALSKILHFVRFILSNVEILRFTQYDRTKDSVQNDCEDHTVGSWLQSDPYLDIAVLHGKNSEGAVPEHEIIISAAELDRAFVALRF